MTKLRNLDLNLLKVLDAIVTEGSVSKASERLSLSQPAISNALNRLRTAMDDPLFIRTSQGMVPTPRTRTISQPVRQALDLVQSCLQEDFTFDYTLSDRTFVIAVEDYGEAVILPRITDWLSQVAPSIKLAVRPERSYVIQKELFEARVDFAIDYFPLHDEGFDNTQLFDDSLVCIARQDHPTVKGSLSMEQYVSLPHVVLTQKPDRTHLIDRKLNKLGLRRNHAIEVPHFLTMPLIVKDTNLLATLPKRIATIYADSFPIKLMPPPMPFENIPIFLVWSRSLESDPAPQLSVRSVPTNLMTAIRVIARRAWGDRKR